MTCAQARTITPTNIDGQGMKATLAIAAIGLLLGGCSSRAEKEFMAGCRDSGGPPEVCSCVSDKLKVQFEKVVKDQRFVLSSEFKTAYSSAATSCMAKYRGEEVAQRPDPSTRESTSQRSGERPRQDSDPIRLEELRKILVEGAAASNAPPAPAASATEPEITSTRVLPATQGPQRVEIHGEAFEATGGVLRVVGDDQRGRQLQLNGQPVARVVEDKLRMVAAYRYPDRDTVLMTKACGSPSCDWTWFLLVDVWHNGQTDVLADDRLSIAAKGAIPEVTPQPDGSLRLAFRSDRGQEQWRYAGGSLSKL